MSSLSDKSAFIGKFFSWGVLAFSAIFVADLVDSTLERSLQRSPESLNFSKVISRANSSKSGINNAKLANLLREPENEQGQSGVALSSEVATKKDPESEQSEQSSQAQDLNGYSLRGTLLCSWYRAAILEQNGSTCVFSEGSELGSYELARVSSNWADFILKKDKTKGVRLILETCSDGDFESADDGDKPVIEGEKVKPNVKKEEEDTKERLSLEDIRAILNDTAKIASQVRVIPQAKDGEPYGTRVIFRRPKNIMAKLGLKNNDILLSVNGNPARTVEDMYQGYMTIRNADNLEFVVDRGGKQTTIRYELAK